MLDTRHKKRCRKRDYYCKWAATHQQYNLILSACQYVSRNHFNSGFTHAYPN
jgi:hypothetical protein